MIHFLKREFETVCIHRFSNNSMPVKNIFKNSFHYWVLSGINMAYWIYRPGFTSGHIPALTSTVGMALCCILWVVSITLFFFYIIYITILYQSMYIYN